MSENRNFDFLQKLYLATDCLYCFFIVVCFIQNTWTKRLQFIFNDVSCRELAFSFFMKDLFFVFQKLLKFYLLRYVSYGVNCNRFVHIII